MRLLLYRWGSLWAEVFQVEVLQRFRVHVEVIQAAMLQVDALLVEVRQIIFVH